MKVGKAILRGFVLFYEGKPPLMFSWHEGGDLNSLSVIFGCGLEFLWKTTSCGDRLCSG